MNIYKFIDATSDGMIIKMTEEQKAALKQRAFARTAELSKRMGGPLDASTIRMSSGFFLSKVLRCA